MKPEEFLGKIKESIFDSVTCHGQNNRDFEEKKKNEISVNFDKYLARRLVYKFDDLPGEFNDYDTDFYLRLFNQTQIHEKIVTLAIMKDVIKGVT